MAARRSFYRISNDVVNREFSKVLVLPPFKDSDLLDQVTKDLNVPIVNKSTNALKQKFNYNSSDSVSKPAIYYIPCQSCPLGYIGETADLDRRMGQHQNDKRNLNTNNAIVKHCIDTNHVINIKNKIVLHSESEIH